MTLCIANLGLLRFPNRLVSALSIGYVNLAVGCWDARREGSEFSQRGVPVVTVVEAPARLSLVASRGGRAAGRVDVELGLYTWKGGFVLVGVHACHRSWGVCCLGFLCTR